MFAHDVVVIRTAVGLGGYPNRKVSTLEGIIRSFLTDHIRNASIYARGRGSRGMVDQEGLFFKWSAFARRRTKCLTATHKNPWNAGRRVDGYSAYQYRRSRY